MYDWKADVEEVMVNMEASIPVIGDAMAYDDLEYDDNVILNAILLNLQNSVLLAKRLLG